MTVSNALLQSNSYFQSRTDRSRAYQSKGDPYYKNFVALLRKHEGGDVDLLELAVQAHKKTLTAPSLPAAMAHARKQEMADYTTRLRSAPAPVNTKYSFHAARDDKGGNQIQDEVMRASILEQATIGIIEVAFTAQEQPETPAVQAVSAVFAELTGGEKQDDPTTTEMQPVVEEPDENPVANRAEMPIEALAYTMQDLLMMMFSDTRQREMAEETPRHENEILEEINPAA